MRRCRFIVRAAFLNRMSDHDLRTHKSTAGHDQRLTWLHAAISQNDSFDHTVFDHNALYDHFSYFQMLLVQDLFLHIARIGQFIRLYPQTLYARSFGRIQHLKLKRRRICGFSHFSAKRIDLSYDDSLSRTANAWITRHRRNHINVHRIENRIFF